MSLDAFAGRLSPDVPETLKRFPLAILLAGLATLLLIGGTTELLVENGELLFRWMMGLATGAIFATGGALFAETRKRGSLLGFFAAYVVPIATVAAWHVPGDRWLVAYALPAIGTLWTSVSATTSGWRSEGRAEAQERFWWLNHLAITSGAIAGVAYLVVFGGTLAIGQTIYTLFGFNLDMALYRIALPAIGGFFVPLYWLSTLPRAIDYTPQQLADPDFLNRAVGMIGNFILIPLLLAYGAILLVYAAQIVITQQLPNGTIGWMVLGFVTAGAGAWLVLHPAFMRDSVIVRFFHRWWFWATIVPLVLYFTAVQVRLSAYGFTPERLLLIWGGVWATSLTALYLFRRGDIRLIPANAAVCLLLATIGPWNIVGLSLTQQSATFDNLLPLTGPNGESYGVTPTWTPEEAEKAVSALDYLVQSEEGRASVKQILHYKGFDFDQSYFTTADVIGVLGVEPSTLDPNIGYYAADQSFTLTRPVTQQVDVSATPFYLGDTGLYSQASTSVAGIDFKAGTDTVELSQNGVTLVTISLAAWFTAEQMEKAPFIDFAIEGRAYRLVLNHVTVSIPPKEDGTGGILAYIGGQLFAGPTPPAPPPAAEPAPTAPAPPAPAT